MRLRSALALLLTTLCGPVGCRSSTSETPGHDAAAPAAPAVTAVAKGLNDPANDATLVGLANAVLACEWKNEPLGRNECPALASWLDSDAEKAPSAEATLFKMLEDERPQVRWLAAYSFTGEKRAVHGQAESAKQLLAAMLAEENDTARLTLANAVCLIDAQATGLDDQLRAALSTGKDRNRLMECVLRGNPTYHSLVWQRANDDSDPELQSEAVWGLRFGPPETIPDAQALWLKRIELGDAERASTDLLSCSVYEHCSALEEKLIAALERRKQPVDSCLIVLPGMFENATKPAVKTRIRKLVESYIVDDTAPEFIRGMLLSSLPQMDQASALKLAKRYESGFRLLSLSAQSILETATADAGTDASAAALPAPAVKP